MEKPLMLSAFLAAAQATIHGCFFALVDAALETILPLLFLTSLDLSSPPLDFAALPAKTWRLARAAEISFMAFIAFVGFMTAFIAFMAFIAFGALATFIAFMAFMAAIVEGRKVRGALKNEPIG